VSPSGKGGDSAEVDSARTALVRNETARRGPAPSRPPGASDEQPWYRQFWPWFLIGLPLTSVAMSFALLTVALRDADSLVRPDHYRAGIEINRDFERDRAAAARGLHAALDVDASGGLTIRLEGDGAAGVQRLGLDLRHPADATRDVQLELDANAPGLFVAPSGVALRAGRFDVRIVPLLPDEGAWRLASRLSLAPGRRATLAPGSAAAPKPVRMAALPSDIRAAALASGLSAEAPEAVRNVVAEPVRIAAHVAPSAALAALAASP